MMVVNDGGKLLCKVYYYFYCSDLFLKKFENRVQYTTFILSIGSLRSPKYLV
jgi:hypothetical protein